MRVCFLLLTMIVAAGCATPRGAVPRALCWLQQNQHPDGYWPNDPACPFKGTLTSLAILAFASEGELADSEEFGKTVSAGWEWLVARVEEKKRVDKWLQGKPAGADLDQNENALLCYALSELYGMTKIPMLKPEMETAASWVIAEQKAWLAKGIPTDPHERSDELCRLAWRVTALKSAVLVGSEADGLKEVFEQPGGALKHLLVTEERTLPPDALTYLLYSLLLLGERGGPEMDAGIVRVSQELPLVWERPPAVPDSAVTPIDPWFFARHVLCYASPRNWKSLARDGREIVTYQMANGCWQVMPAGVLAGRARWVPYFTTPPIVIMLHIGSSGLPTYRQSRQAFQVPRQSALELPLE